VEDPLRLLEGDFPRREATHAIAEHNIERAPHC
jgi:hypothetical protein